MYKRLGSFDFCLNGTDKKYNKSLYYKLQSRKERIEYSEFRISNATINILKTVRDTDDLVKWEKRFTLFFDLNKECPIIQI